MQVSFMLWLQTIENPVLTALFKSITLLGSDAVYIIFIAWLYWCKDVKKGEKWAYLVLGSALLNGIVKLSFKATRPFLSGVGVTAVDASTATGYSFPSGHSQASSAFGSFLALEYREKWIKAIGIVMFLAIGCSRLYLRVHWPIDVLAGWTLGLTMALIFYFFYEKHEYAVKGMTWVFFLISVLWFRDPDQIKLFGLFSAVIVGMGLSARGHFVKIHPFGKGGKRKLLLGILVVLGTQVGLKMILPESLNVVRYFAIGFNLSYLYPLIFARCYSSIERRKL